jgi:hypothetical protein
MQRQKVIGGQRLVIPGPRALHRSPVNRRLLDRQRSVQACLAAIRSILVNNPALGCLVDGRDHCLHILCLRFCSSGRNAFLHFAQARKNTSIAERAHGCLTSAFGSRFCVGHWKRRNCERGGSRTGGHLSRRDALIRTRGSGTALTTRPGQSEAVRLCRRSCEPFSPTLSLAPWATPVSASGPRP